jgi:putative DNA primase/helicase
MGSGKKVPPSKSRKAHASRYAEQGWAVVCLHTIRKDGSCSCTAGAKCSRRGKHPRTLHGVKDATTDAGQVRSWWAETPLANVGIATGPPSGILVLDVDPRHGGTETLQKLEAEFGPLPVTVTARTGGGGRHLIFQYPSFQVRKDSSGKLLGPGLDILSDGCIMVAPPSKHGSGKRYHWEEGKAPKDIEPATLPGTWLGRLRGNTAVIDSAQPPAERLVVEGHRNSYLTSIAGTIQRSGASPEALLAALAAENRVKCSPPLDTAEVDKIVASVTQYPAPPIRDGADAAEGLMHLVLDRYFGGGKHLMLSTDGRFWHYEVRLWRPVQDQWVAGKVLETIEGNPVKNQKTASVLSQVLTLLKAKLAAKDDLLGFVAEPAPVINCSNGELWIAQDGNVELRPHRPESYLRHCLDVAYDPEAACPEYDQAVLEIFGKADNPKAMVRHWNELLGYVIQPKRNIPLIVILYGSGDNGKTKLIGTATRLLGSQLVHAQRVDDLDKNRFAIGSLFGKYLFVDDDVRAGARLPDGILKTISEAKEVTGELKYQRSFNFVVRTVPVLLCNNIPSLADLSHGMVRRLMVIPFDRTFTKDEKDPDLFDRIWDNELSGVLNRALRGHQRLLERGTKFKYPMAVSQAGTHLLQQANPLPAFIEAHCSKKGGGGCLVQDFYRAYSTWTHDMGYTLTQTQQVVTRNLQHLGFATKKTNRGIAVLGLTLV